MIRSALFAGVFGLSLAGAAALAQDTTPGSDQPQTQGQPQDQNATPKHRHKVHQRGQQQAMAQKSGEHTKATDQIADRLNACQERPESERQDCLQNASKGG